MSTLQQHFQNLHLIIQRGRAQASAAATVYALETYWHLGAYLSHRLSESTYGKRVVQEFADWLQTVEPGIKGYDWRSLYRMREFFEQWHHMDWTIAGHTHIAMLPTQSTEGDFSEKILGSAIPKLPEMPAVLTHISWTHHLELLKRCTSPEEKLFYLILSIRERYKVRELIRQIKSSLFERQMLAKKTLLLPEHPKKDLLADIFRDIYLVEFLDVREPHSSTNSVAKHNRLSKRLSESLNDNPSNFARAHRLYEACLRLGGEAGYFRKKMEDLEAVWKEQGE